MVSPSICVAMSANGPYKISYLTDKRKFEMDWSPNSSIRIRGFRHDDWTHPIQRFQQLANWTMRRIPLGEKRVYMEDYAMGAKGQTFTIGECGGILKREMWSNDIKYKLIAPTAVKKFATSKGTAKKDMMYESWLKETGIDLLKGLDMKSCSSPLSDIVDSYFICRLAISKVDS